MTTEQRNQAIALYRGYGWPLALRGHDLSVDLDALHGVALLIPTRLASEVITVLIGRRCAPAVLAHPAMPLHRIVLAGERFPVQLYWPAGTHRVTSSVPLPPTVTARGPVLWTDPPQPHSLKLCREVDVAAALRTVLSNPPPSTSPTRF